MLDKFNSFIFKQSIDTKAALGLAIKDVYSKIKYAAILYVGIILYIVINFASAKFLSAENAILVSAAAMAILCAPFVSIDRTNKTRIPIYNIFMSISTIMIGLYISLHIVDPNMDTYKEYMENLNLSALILSVLIFAPVSEELFFRGFLFKYINKIGVPIYVSMIISSIAFVLVHGTLSHTIPAFIMGMFFCIVYYYTNNILYNIICHSMYNLMTLILGVINIGVNSILIIAYIIMLVVTLFYFSKYIQEEKELC